MGMTVNQFGVDSGKNIGQLKLIGFLSNLGMVHNLQQKIAQLPT
jgi:hypothetical protein